MPLQCGESFLELFQKSSIKIFPLRWQLPKSPLSVLTLEACAHATREDLAWGSSFYFN